jgi:hypothetical protein
MKTKFNKSMIGIALIGLLMVSISSCKKDREDYTRVKTNLSVVNAVEGSAPQDVYIDDTKTSTPPVNYGDAPTTVAASEGNVTVTLKNTGTSVVTASTTLNSTADVTPTLYLSKQANGSLALTQIATDATVTASVPGKAKVRFINLGSILSSTINAATSTGVSLATSLSLGASTAYQDVDAATPINLTVAGSAEVTTVPGATIQAGKVYTIWLDGATGTKVKYHVVVDK